MCGRYSLLYTKTRVHVIKHFACTDKGSFELMWSEQLILHEARMDFLIIIINHARTISRDCHKCHGLNLPVTNTSGFPI